MKKLILCILFFSVSLFLWAENNHDWILEYTWDFEAGYWEPYPCMIFRKLEIQSEAIIYQMRLRREQFMLMYQIDGQDELYKLEDKYSNSAYNDIYYPEYSNNYTLLAMKNNNHYISVQSRVGHQEYPQYPLVGIWGRLPYLTEYRIVNPRDCKYYIEITEKIPNQAVRTGTYLLRQIGDNLFETVSSFPDGSFRLEIMNEGCIKFTPLFTLPADENGVISNFYIINRGQRINN